MLASKTEHVLPPFQVLNTRSLGQGLFDGTPYLPHYKSIILTRQP